MLQVSCAPLKKTGKFFDPDMGRLSMLVRYCTRDVLLMAEAWRVEGLGDPHPDDEVLDAHVAIDRTGVLVDLDAAAAVKRAADNATQRAVAKVAALLSKPVEDTLTFLRSPKQIGEWLEDAGVDVDDATAASLRGVLLRNPAPEVRTVIEGRLAVCRVTAGKAQAILNRTGGDGRLRGVLAYHAAHTGRWAGRGFQPQNLPRGIKIPVDVWDDPEAAPAISEREDVDEASLLGSMLRGLVIASPSWKLAIIDYSSVEARGLLWLAGDTDGLEDYRQGVDAYKRIASSVFSVGYDEVTKLQRHAGKTAVLACGYGGGPDALERYAAGSGLDLAALGVTPVEVVDGWRDANTLVAGAFKGRIWETPDGRKVRCREGGLWKNVAQAAKQATINPGEVFRAGRCDFRHDGNHLNVVLPSGRPIVYRHMGWALWPSRWGGEQNQLVYMHPKFGRVSTFGGKLVENLVQAVCRDLLAHALATLHRWALPDVRVVLHVHDEIIAEVRESSAEEGYRNVESAMLQKPLWAEGFPIAVEGHMATRYGKE